MRMRRAVILRVQIGYGYHFSPFSIMIMGVLAKGWSYFYAKSFPISSGLSSQKE